MKPKRRTRPPKVSIVRVEGKKSIEVHFDFDPSIVEIMRAYQGRYQPYPVKHWTFPEIRQGEIIHALKSKGFHPRIELHQKKESSNWKYPDGPDVVSVLSKCRKCGQMAFVNKDRICGRCS